MRGIEPSLTLGAGRLACAALLAAVAACGNETRPVNVFVTSVDFTSAPGLDNRYDYEVSGEDFDDPHVRVTDRVFAVESERPRIDIDDGRRLLADFDEPAPYLSGTPMRLLVTFGAVPGLEPASLDVEVQGVLRSLTAPGRAEIPVLVRITDGFAEAQLELVTDDLPTRVDLYELELAWNITPRGCAQDCVPADFVTRHLVPTTWRAPREEAPRYRQAMVWSSAFAAGEWPGGDETEASEIGIAHAMLAGFATLNDQAGKSYGAFPRPDYDGEVDGVDVWLDFERSACGELKHGLMALMEYQGVDAKWGVLQFSELGSDRFSMYETYEVVALGREPMVWYQTNHAFVTVHGQVFDPTYNGHAKTVAEYEDALFARFCYGKDEPCWYARDWCNYPPEEGVHCVDNPPGRSDDLGLGYFYGDSYR